MRARMSANRDGPSPWVLPALIVVFSYVLWLLWQIQPYDITEYYLFRQDLPVLGVLTILIAASAYVRFPLSLEREQVVSNRTLGLAALLLLVFSFAGFWLFMHGHHLSRDESLAIFGAEQFAQGGPVTNVPAAYSAFGDGMFPEYGDPRVSPQKVWVSSYLPINSALLWLSGNIAHHALLNPVLLIIGLAAVWDAARRIWPTRRDTALVVTLLAASSSQLIVTSMTAYAMTGQFAFNALWLALLVRRTAMTAVAALLVAFVAMGLHKFHFHLMVALPFLCWLVVRREWRLVAIYGLGYTALTLFWWSVYAGWLLQGLDTVPNSAGAPASLADYILSRLQRFADFSPMTWFANFLRFAVWQNILLLPLGFAALRTLRSPKDWSQTAALPLAGVCGLGLLLMIYQGHGWGYRYLSSQISAFCLLAGYGWNMIQSDYAPGRACLSFKLALAAAFLFQLPTQLAMARSFSEPYARLHDEVVGSGRDFVLFDIRDGFYVRDVIRNHPDFARTPKMIDFTLVEENSLYELCRNPGVGLVDSRHYRALGIAPVTLPDSLEESIASKRDLLEDLDCGVALEIPVRNSQGR